MRKSAKVLLFSATLSALPIALAGWVGTRFVDAAGRLGAALAERQPDSDLDRLESRREVTLVSDALPVDTGVELELESEAPADDQPRSRPLRASTARAPATPTGPSVRPQRKLIGIRIREAKVLALSRSAGLPSGTLVAASAERPAGLMLSGVGGLGVGVQDGDVLTHAAGQPVRSVAQVIGLVAGARHARAKAISGTVYRGAQQIQLNVEIPYPKRRGRLSRSADESAAPANTAKAKRDGRLERAPHAASSKDRRGARGRAGKHQPSRPR